jgi:iron complex transport system ATP-binding protein
MNGLDVHDLVVRRDGKTLLDGVSLTVGRGELLAIIGVNGAGKSTLIRTILSGRATSGRVRWFGRDFTDWPRRRLARRVAYLAQRPGFDPEATVADTLAAGRSAHWSAFGAEREVDVAATRTVADRLDLTPWLARRLGTLSGGERQRVLLGRTLVAIEGEPDAAIVLDEPDANLDLSQAARLGRRLREIADAGRCVVMASHDLNLAARVADRVALLHEGRLVATGEPAGVLTEDRLREAFGLEVQVVPTEVGPVVVSAG